MCCRYWLSPCLSGLLAAFPLHRSYIGNQRVSASCSHVRNSSVETSGLLTMHLLSGVIRVDMPRMRIRKSSYNLNSCVHSEATHISMWLSMGAPTLKAHESPCGAASENEQDLSASFTIWRPKNGDKLTGKHRPLNNI